MDKILGFIGLAKKAGSLKTGEESTGIAVRAGRAKAIILASDASGNAKRRASGFAGSGPGIPLLELPFTKSELSDALGKGGCAMAAVTDIGFADGIARRLCETDRGKYGEQAARLQKKNQRAARLKSGSILSVGEKKPGRRRSKV